MDQQVQTWGGGEKELRVVKEEKASRYGWSGEGREGWSG